MPDQRGLSHLGPTSPPAKTFLEWKDRPIPLGRMDLSDLRGAIKGPHRVGGRKKPLGAAQERNKTRIFLRSKETRLAVRAYAKPRDFCDLSIPP